MTTARLLPVYTRLYPTLERGRWYPVVLEEAHGVWLGGPGLGDPFLTPGRAYVCRHHFEIR